MSKQKRFTRRTFLLAPLVGLLVAGLLAGESWLRSPEAEGRWVFIKEQPQLVVSPVPIPYQRKVRVMIAGSGFEPKQEIALQIELGGVPTDISYMLEPRPVPNEFGAFASTWIVDGEIQGKLLSPTAYTLRAEDENGFILAHAPLVFAAEKKKDPKAEAKKDEAKKPEAKTDAKTDTKPEAKKAEAQK